MSAISGIDTSYTSAISTTSDSVSMGKNDFLLLLVAQLENQDPMNPEDATEFTSQLAQFSSLEQLENANKSLEELASMSGEMERMSAFGLIGQDIVAQTEKFHFSGDPVQLGYRLDNQADNVKLYVLNQTGSTVATVSAQETGVGEHFVDWDGLGDLGMPLDPGDYSLVIRAVDDDDNIVSSDSLIKSRVEAVDMTGTATQLETDAGTFAMSKIEKAGVAL
ncbi:flagellar basal-body rod modification protein FlgD [Desulfuromusa kysingii]|uniref:Basal-body rod modification protein FlgD n=1 Tax=Desulfuromusa kysingii TaxID=37625 RepID=A0A1H3VH97_9BACT|nr:flagellar hook assembly protein FlgD [Desulfuromusa kysingii]SDZ74136.1 flagellar basal-body rod modification protein FlgD [Desulfuromusa kysingii]